MPPLKSKGQTVDKKQKAEEVKPETKRQKNEKNSESKTTQPTPQMPNDKHKHKGQSPTPERGKTRERNAKGRTNKDFQKRGKAQDTKRPADSGNRSVKGSTVNGRAVKRQVKKKGECQVITKGRTNKASELPSSPKAVKRKVGPPSKNVRKQSSDSEDDESDSVRSSESEREEEDSKDEEQEQEEEEEEGPGSNEEPVETQGSSESSDEEAEVSDSLKDLKRDTEGTPAEEESEELTEGEETRERKSTTEEEADEEDHAEEVRESEAATSDSSGGKKIRKGRTPEKRTTGKGIRSGRRQTPLAPEPPRQQRGRMFKKTKADKQAEKAEKARAKAEKQRAEKEAKQKAKEEKKNKKKNKKQGVRAEPEKVEPPEGPNKTEKARSKAQLLRLANKTKNIKQVTVASDTDPDEEEDEDEEEEEATPTLLPATKSRSQLIILKAKSKNLKTSLLSKAAKEGQKGDVGDPMVNPKEEASEGESNKPNERLLARRRGVATLRRVSGWINKKLPKSFSMKTKMVPWCKVISISNWITFRALKPKDGTRKSKSNFLKHRMAMRMASKTNLSSMRSRSDGKDRRSTEKAVSHGQAEEGVDEAFPAGDKELEAKYAVVLPRINKPGLAKAVPLASTPTNSTMAPASATPSTPKPPKPGARLVLPVKPDLSLLKCIKKKPVLGGSTAGGESVEGGTDSGVRATATPSAPEGSSDSHARSREATSENQEGVSILQAARGKLGTRHLNLTKTSLLGGASPASGPARPRGPDPEREAVTRGPRATAEAGVQNRGTGRMGVGSTYEEEADREVAQLMCDDEATYAAGQPEIHWAGCAQMSGDPQDWLRGENLLPHQTVEKLTKQTVYDEDQGRALTVPAHNGRGPWESEDPAQDMLESRLNSTQVVMAGSEQAVEVDEVEDLAQLDEVCESSVLLNLKKRFHRDCIYTYIGDMLISVNPFRPLHIYTEDARLQYQAKEKHRNPPHVYAIAEAAFTHSQNTAQEQCVVISGQSGSGKTEATKLMIHYLCSMYQGMHDNLRQPTEVLPILESFGNAKTILNNNSSRFGKYLHIHILQ